MMTRRTRALAVSAVFVTSCALPATAVSSPTATVLQSTGDKANRIDMMLIGDGYTAAEMGLYASHIDNVINHMFDTGGLNTGITNPYARYQNYFNIIRIDVESNESGVDIIGPNNTTIQAVDTALNGRLGATYGGIYYPQSITIDYIFAAPNIINQAAGPLGYTHSFVSSDFDWEFAAVNTTAYGGEASSFATFSAGHPLAGELAVHEGGHWNHRLADEYGGIAQAFPFVPVEVNLSSDDTGGDWSHWLGYNDPNTGVVGAFEGGRGYDTGVWHPSIDSKMNSLDIAFDAIAREKIVLDIYEIIDPIDASLDNIPTYTLQDELWIEVIDPAVVLVEWLVDGQPLPGQTEETLDLSDIVSLLGPGDHTITARAYDEILNHSFSDNNNPHPLDLVRRDFDDLEQTIDYQVSINWLIGDTDFDGDVDQTDLNTILAGFGNVVDAGDPEVGDLDGDGQISINDIDLALAYWTGEAPPVLVPEPTTALALLTLGLLRRRRN